MAKLIGRRQGLDQKKLAALEKVLKQAGITGQREILSGLRDHDEVIRVYNRDIKRYGLKSYLDKLPESSKKAIRERILRAEYKGKDKPIIPKYLPYNPKTKKGGYDLPGLKKQLKKDGLSDKDIDKVVVGVQRFRRENAGFGSTHLQGKKVDIPRYLLVKPEIIKLFVDKGYKILDEEGKGIWDIAFPVPGQKGSYKKISGKRKSSSSKPGFKKAFDEARGMGQKEFEFDGKKFSTRMRGESVEEFEEKFKPVDLRGPEMQRDQYLEDQDDDLTEEIIKIKEEARKPEPEIKPEEMPLDSPEPFGVFARGTPEFEMAEEQEKEKLMMAAEGGEVESKRFISSLPLETRRKLANEELDEIGFRRIKEARKKRGVEKGFQAGRVLPEEVESIEKKYGVFGEMSGEEQIQGFQTGGEVDDVPEFLRRPPEDRQPEDFRIQDVTEMDIEEPEPKPMPEPEPDLSGPEFDRDQYLLEQKSTQELMDTSIPGVGRPPQVNRELMRRKREAESGFEVGKGPTLAEIAAGEEEEARREEAKQRKEVNRQKRERDKANKIVVEDKSQKELDEAELRKAIDDSIVQAEKTAQSIDPKRFFKKMSTFDKIVGLIGLAAGAYESYQYGGPNFYEKEIEKEVEKDIKLQKLGLEDEKRKLGVANFKVAQIAKKLAMSTKNEEQRIRLLQTVQKFQQAGAKEAAAAQKQKGLMNVNFILNTRGITDAEMAKFDSLYPGLKVRANSIKGRGGLNFFVRGGSSNLAKVKTYLADAQDSIDGLTDLYSYFDKVSLFEQAVPLFSVDAAEAQSLRDRLVGKLRIEFFGPGVMTDSERAQAKKILGDPNALLTTDSREKPKILKLIMKLNYGVRDKLRRDGVAIPKTPNDLRIQQMLSRRKLQDNAKNRRFVIDALIQGEIDAQKAGKAPGSLWNMNEPLPV